MISDVTEVETRHNKITRWTTGIQKWNHMDLKAVTDNIINRIRLFGEYFVPGGSYRIIGLSVS
jgi:hypothetical protein